MNPETLLPGGPATALAARLDELEHTRSADVESRLLRARAIEAEARVRGDREAEMRARLVTADMLQRTGASDEGASLAMEVNAWAAAEGTPSLLARSHLVLSSVLEDIGDTATGLDHAVRAIDLLPDDAEQRTRGIHLMRLADSLAVNGPAEQSRRRYREAEAIFAALGDVELMRTVLNNLAMLEHESGEVEAALDVIRTLRASGGDDALDAAIADTAARVYLAAGDLDEAEAAIDRGLRLLEERGDVQAATPAELALTRTAALVARGLLDEAEAELDRCRAICEERRLTGMLVETLRVRAELHATAGRFEAAYHAHRAFHAESEALRSRRQEAAARTRQALFETAEAQRSADAFREQARTDPLTELRNRRFVDEEIPRYLQEADARGGRLVVAIVDVDHFKSVNDRFTHPVGDEVLRQVARSLAAVADAAASSSTPSRSSPREERPAGLAARLGGEEFLVVQVVDDPALAYGRLDEMRRALAARRWDGLAPGLRVTVSIGATEARPGDTQLPLLSRADAHLYRAKAAGRDRIVGDDA